MAPERPQDTAGEARRNGEREDNPFVAFRHHVDNQLNSLFGSVFSLPSAIFNHGQEHSRMWSQHRSDRLRAMEKEEQEERRDLSREWERAMKDFEDSEKEAKEWYDKVLRQITARRDEHLESGFGFGGMDRGMQEEVKDAAPQCPYLPPKAQREQSPIAVDVNKEDTRCSHPKRWVCERDYPQSRFLDWVWTGWGGPSTTPNMLWHCGHKQSGAPPYASSPSSRRQQAQESMAMMPAKQGPVLSRDDPRVQEALATAGQESAEPEDDQHNTVSQFAYLILNKNSPIHLENDPELGVYGTQWRTAYEDLLRAHESRGLTSTAESEDDEKRAPFDWLLQVASRGRREEFLANGFSGDASTIAGHLLASVCGSQSEPADPERVLYNIFGGRTGETKSKSRTDSWRPPPFDSDTTPASELDMYERLSGVDGLDRAVDGRGKTFEKMSPWQSKRPSVGGAVTETDQWTLPNGNSVTRTITSNPNDDGHSSTVVVEEHFDPTGRRISFSKKSSFRNNPAADDESLAGWLDAHTSNGGTKAASPREPEASAVNPSRAQRRTALPSAPQSLGEFEQVWQERFKENREPQGAKSEPAKSSSGWFWKS